MGADNKMASLTSLLLLLLPYFLLAAAADPPAPQLFTVEFVTDISDTPIIIEVTRSLAPLGADRFFALVQDGFYNQSALFRVVPDFVLQFGISGSSDQNEIKDDPVVGSNTRGTISYATAGPDSRTTQLFINYGDNSQLDSMGFAPFGEVVIGLDVAEEVFNPTPGDSNGVDQDSYEKRGNNWIRENYPGINFILSASVSTQHA